MPTTTSTTPRALSPLFRNIVVAILFAYASLTVLWTIFLWFLKMKIHWESRTIASTCYDPQGDFWGNAAYDGEWIICYQQYGDDPCTPWGYSCAGGEDMADLCPLNYGGSGDGCIAPSIAATVVGMYTHPRWIEDPMWAGQVGLQKFLVFILCPAVAIIAWRRGWPGRSTTTSSNTRVQPQQQHVPLELGRTLADRDNHDNVVIGDTGNDEGLYYDEK